MHYLYHLAPQNLVGTTLYPLNQLKEKRPELFEKEVSKYAGRERVQDIRIPSLGNCLWNDVLFLVAVPPAELRRALVEAGLTLPTLTLRFFEIDPRALNLAHTTVMLPGRSGRLDDCEYKPFDPANLGTYSRLSHQTVEYYREQKELGRRPLLFAYVPHILYRGTLNISESRIVET